MKYNKWTFLSEDKKTNSEFRDHMRRQAISQFYTLIWMNLLMVGYHSYSVRFENEDTFQAISHVIMFLLSIVGYYVTQRWIWSIEIFVFFFFLARTLVYILYHRELAYKKMALEDQEYLENAKSVNDFSYMIACLCCIMLTNSNYIIEAYIVMPIAWLSIICVFIFKSMNMEKTRAFNCTLHQLATIFFLIVTL